MISAWQIYIVMQLDSIGGTLTFISIAMTILACVMAIRYFGEKYDQEVWEDVKDTAYGRKDWNRLEAEASSSRKIFKFSFVTAVVCLLVNSAIPSSKTAAAMIVIPAIANNEAIQREAGDLYQLAKKGLANLVSDDKREQSK